MNDKETAEFADRLLGQLARVPTWGGLSFRGMHGRITFGTEVQTAVARGLVATSRNPRVATENFTAHGLFAILGSTGRGIESLSQFPDEEEIVFLPGSVFKFVATANFEGMPITIAHQGSLSSGQENDLDLGTSSRKIASAIRTALGAGPLTVMSPGKFVGDLD